VPVWNDLWYSARSLTRTPGWAVPLLVTIALGIGSNAAVYGFVRGLITLDLPLAGIDTLVSLFALDAYGAAGPLSYDDYRSLQDLGAFESVGAARESQDNVVLADRSSLMPVAAVTSELANMLQLPLDGGVVISHRVWQTEFDRKGDVRGGPIRVGGADTRVAGVAPDWLEGLYQGREVDVWVLLRDDSRHGLDRTSRTLSVLGRRRSAQSVEETQRIVNARDNDAEPIAVLPYTGLMPDYAAGMVRVGTLLRAAAAAVFLIACANVASLLLARASARSHETSVRVALGAGRGRLTGQLLSDSVLISVIGGAAGLLLAMWTVNIIPALLFDQDAEDLVFAPDVNGIVAMAAACAAMTIACGLVPLFELRDDNPAVVLQRESAGPRPAMRRLRSGLVLVQMACCSVLVIATGLLLQGFHNALETNAGHRIGEPVLATVEPRPFGTRDETARHGFEYFDAVETTARSVVESFGTAWAMSPPGSRPAWQSLRAEPAKVPLRDIVVNVAPFTGETLTQVTVPPIAGRLFGPADTLACPVVIANQEAAEELFGGDAIGQSVEDPAGQQVEIIGVVATRPAEDRDARRRPTIYYYAEQMDTPLGLVGPARFGVPITSAAAYAVVDANVVSRGYFNAMGLSLIAGRIFGDDSAPTGCRVAVVNQEAAELYFGGNAVGGAVIDRAGRRAAIIGVVRSTPLRTSQRRADPTIYFPMRQDFQPRMTLMLDGRDVSDTVLEDLHRRLDMVPGRGRRPIIVTTLDAHLRRTALAPARVGSVLVGASAATALALGILGLYAVMIDTTRLRRREFALRLALGATRARVVRLVFTEGVRLALAGTITGMLASLLVAAWLARITPIDGLLSLWVWVAAPVVLVGAVAVASVLPARRALVDPLTIMREK
jgi:predicted permease